MGYRRSFWGSRAGETPPMVDEPTLEETWRTPDEHLTNTWRARSCVSLARRITNMIISHCMIIYHHKKHKKHMKQWHQHIDLTYFSFIYFFIYVIMLILYYYFIPLEHKWAIGVPIGGLVRESPRQWLTNPHLKKPGEHHLTNTHTHFPWRTHRPNALWNIWE